MYNQYINCYSEGLNIQDQYKWEQQKRIYNNYGLAGLDPYTNTGSSIGINSPIELKPKVNKVLLLIK